MLKPPSVIPLPGAFSSTNEKGRSSANSKRQPHVVHTSLGDTLLIDYQAMICTYDGHINQLLLGSL